MAEYITYLPHTENKSSGYYVVQNGVMNRLGFADLSSALSLHPDAMIRIEAVTQHNIEVAGR